MLPRAAVAFPAFAAIMIASAAFALLSAPREYQGWVTQEWGQLNQDEHRRALYEPPFQAGKAGTAYWDSEPPLLEPWKSHSIPGQVALQYFPEVSKAGFGWAVNFRNEYDSASGIETGFLDFRRMPSGELVASDPIWKWGTQSFTCRGEGTPILTLPLPFSESTPTSAWNVAFVFGSLTCIGEESWPAYFGVFGFCWEKVRPNQYSQCLGASVGNASTDVYNAVYFGGGLGSTGDPNRTFPHSSAYTDIGFFFGDVQAQYANWTDECDETIECNDGNTYSASECSPGKIYKFVERKEEYGYFDLIWQIDLKTGEPSCRPPPIGQPTPPPMRYYRTITSPTVHRTDLLVIGAALNYPADKSNRQENSALLAFDPKSGSLLWTFTVPGEYITPEPVILDSVIIFGTNKGRVFCLEHSGNLRWSTAADNRLTYQPAPYTSAARLETTALYGPAIQLSQVYAYFAGSDGRIHRYDTMNGNRVSSNTLAYYRSTEIDNNGLNIIKPCPIRTAPAVGGNDFLITKPATENQDSQKNGSYLMVVKIPELTFNPLIAPTHKDYYCLDPEGASFTKGSLQYGGLPLGQNVKMLDDLIYLAYLIDDPYYNFRLGKDQQDTGGVTLAEGYAIASNRGAQILAVPSCNIFLGDPTGGQQILPKTPPVLDMAPPLGPVRVYPNPFDPARAVNGTLKFRNLPRGSRIEISTLAHELVSVLYENNNRAAWHGRNQAGQEVASGVYIYRIVQPEGAPTITGQIALIRR